MAAHTHAADAPFWRIALLWFGMMGAMMAPAAWPWVRAFHRFAEADLAPRARATAQFASGYLLAWLGYAIGALSTAVAQNLVTIIVVWAIFGGIGASILLLALQSLIHGNFEGAAQKRASALVGAAAAIAAAVGPLIGGFITTYLSWRIAFLLEC